MLPLDPITRTRAERSESMTHAREEPYQKLSFFNIGAGADFAVCLETT